MCQSKHPPAQCYSNPWVSSGQISGNVTDLGYTYDDLLSKNLRDIINMDDLERIPLQAREFKPMVSFPVEFGVGDLKETFTGSFHVRGKWGFIEFERPGDTSTSAQIPLRTLSQQLSGVADLLDGCQLLTDAVQQSLDYDRVLMYMFHRDWHGEVVAETLKPGYNGTSFKGLHFPEYDIPRQARACYIRNLYTHTPHVKHEEAQLVPMECPIHQERPDMTLVSLRTPAPGCIQYHLNLGITGMLIYSILVNGKLWGLVTCHHSIPGKFVPFDLRVAVAMTVQAFSLFAKEKEAEKVRNADITSGPARQRILKMVEEGSGLRAAIASQQSNILDVLECSGAAVAFGNKVHRFGTTPTPKQVQRLVDHVHMECKGWLCTADLSQNWDEALGFSEPEIGVLALCNVVSSVAERVCLLWFRMPIDVEREWGGDPASAFTSTGMRARVNFSPCLQATTIPAEPWSEAEQEVARKLWGSLGVKKDDSGEQSGAEADESSPKAEQQSPFPVVAGEDGPSTMPSGGFSQPSPSLQVVDEAPRGSVDGGGCWPIKKLFRKNGTTTSSVAPQQNSPAAP